MTVSNKIAVVQKAAHLETYLVDQMHVTESVTMLQPLVELWPDYSETEQQWAIKLAVSAYLDESP